MNLHAPEELSSKETSLDGFESQLCFFQVWGQGRGYLTRNVFSSSGRIW
jgi:hypothetical protein